MPFTLSHAAATLPFRKFEPVWPALVIGTFAPDLQYFVQISNEDRSGHRFPEVFFFTIPFALLTLFVFEWIVKRPAMDLLPLGWQRRLTDKRTSLSFRGGRQFGAIVFWIAVGVGTHLVWDQFTHSYSWLANHWSLLQVKLDLPVLHVISVAHLMQHISTIVGLAILVVWLASWYRRTEVAPLSEKCAFSPLLKLALIATMCIVAFALGYPLAIVRMADHSPPITKEVFVVTYFEATTFVLGLQMLVFGVALTLTSWLRRAPTQNLSTQDG